MPVYALLLVWALSLSLSLSLFRDGRGRGSDPLPRRLAPPQIVWGSQVRKQQRQTERQQGQQLAKQALET